MALRPLRDNIMIIDMEFEEEKTTSGIIIPSQNGKDEGIKPRWGKVYAIGPEQKDVKVGQWICLAHGRWSRGLTIEEDTGEKIVIRKADNDAILLVSDEKPTGTI
jgi:co-chaperonin GroES (HSP10)